MLKLKKASMFGIEGEPLKKQSGGLFLARLQRLTFRLVEGHQATRILNSKASMFGLDARIALAIMGIIGLIVGYNGYGVVQTSKVNKIIYESQEIFKAISAYEYNTSSEMEILESNSVLKAGELMTSSKTGWQGPYLGRMDISSSDAVKYVYSKVHGNISILRAKDRGAALEADSPFVQCTDGSNCYLWLLFEAGKIDNQVATSLDSRLDGGDGWLAGKIQKYNGALLFRGKVTDF